MGGSRRAAPGVVAEVQALPVPEQAGRRLEGRGEAELQQEEQEAAGLQQEQGVQAAAAAQETPWKREVQPELGVT